MTNTESKIPIWFWIVSIILLLWNVIGILNFLGQVTLTQEDINAMGELERSMIENRPSWVYVAFGLAVFAGSLGSIALFLKKKLASSLFLASLVGVIFQMGESIVSAPAEAFTPAVIGLTATIVLVAIFAVWFGKHAVKRGWLK